MKTAGVVLATLLALTATAALVAWASGWWSQGGWAHDKAPSVVWLGVIAALMSSGILASLRFRPVRALRDIVIWVVLFLLIVAGYSFRDDAKMLWGRIRGELAPGVATMTAPGEVQIVRAGDSHFHVDASVNDATIAFMVDTGASMVALSWADARAAGIDPASLAFNRRVATASGIALAADIIIDRIVIGPIERRAVKGVVLPRESGDASLLGLSFLDTLTSYAVSGDRLTLRN